VIAPLTRCYVDLPNNGLSSFHLAAARKHRVTGMREEGAWKIGRRRERNYFRLSLSRGLSSFSVVVSSLFLAGALTVCEHFYACGRFVQLSQNLLHTNVRLPSSVCLSQAHCGRCCPLLWLTLYISVAPLLSCGLVLVSGHIDVVVLRPARLVLGWTTAAGVQIPVAGNLSLSNQPPKSTQPGHPSKVKGK